MPNGSSFKKLLWLVPLIILAVVAGMGLSSIIQGRDDGDAEPRMEAGAAEAPGQHNCRFWGCISDSIPGRLISDHLIDLPYSMAYLSQSNPDGWSLVGIPESGDEPLLQRGAKPAYKDSLFPPAVAKLRDLRPSIALCHIRNCSSGLCDIPNPHPFEREKNDRRWFMAHNGSVDKDVLLRLIRPDYLAENPPAHGDSLPDWIDSELYFLYLLQTCEDHGWDVKSALGEVILNLRLYIPGDYHYLNIILSDGETLWAYREGVSLFFLHGFEVRTSYTAIASRYPCQEQGNWISMENGELLTAGPAGPPLLEQIEDFFDLTGTPGDEVAASSKPALSCNPNPCNPSSLIRCVLPVTGHIDLAVFDARGRRVTGVAAGHYEAGPHEYTWDGCDEQGREVPSGVYLLRLEHAQGLERGKLTLLR